MRTKLTKIALMAALALAAAFTLSCSGDDDDEDLPGSNLAGGGDSSSSDGGRSSSSIGVVYGESVNYGGETYRTVVIGTQTWFARNLNYYAEGSKCYGDDPANCDVYGRLYDWETALAVCPSGWHLPSNEEWDELMLYVEDDAGVEHYYRPYTSFTVGGYLTATSVGERATDEYGFSALPGGYGSSSGSFNGIYDVGSYGIWWSASGSDSKNDHVLCWMIGGLFFGLTTNKNDDSYWQGCDKLDYVSIRCLKD